MNDDTYRVARERVEQFLARDRESVGELGRSVVLDRGRPAPRAALLLHGLSASPAQFIEVAHRLHERGYNVLVPRLPKHGYRDRMSDALARLTADELRRVTRTSLEIVRGLGSHVTVAGFSLGGLMVAWIAQREAVDAAVSIAPFLGVAFVPNRWSARLAQWTLRLPNRFAWWDPIKREKQMPAHGYPRYATHALAQAYTIAGELLASARTAPPKASRIVVVTNAHEAAVNNRTVRELVRAWRAGGAQNVETFEFKGLPIGHDIIEPLRNPAVVQRVYPVLLDLIDR